METFSVLQVLCAGNSPVTSEFPSQRAVTQSFYLFFDLRLNEGWVNNHWAGDWRRHRAHYDITLMDENAIILKKFTLLTAGRVILCMGPANERRHYNVTSSLIGLVHTQSDPRRQVVILTTPSAASDETFIKLTTCLVRSMYLGNKRCCDIAWR